ncbi:VOC family protein [Rufibacter quisquiliarum]|uniref:Catechol 2,3-dioxygenase-like lactoylglutathione lyase family enzyme n=1 Tax=Rufibacter quisquiliarum TaxID=1549639 RepID=A0A839GB52_9BACT|nr:VOC family protein [Rufibacter quisquiliarum]MBA9075530.1 catechol 2,3-dioxygenase-like lactoylglutathione lyase family enzyme [Rufibacter quisquiliarum]
MEFRQIKETCLYVQDLARTTRFYADTLGLPIIGEVPDRHVFFRAGSSVLLCFNAQKTRESKDLPPHFGEGQLHLAFECEAEDYARWKDKLRQANLAIEHEQTWPHGRKSCYFRDPDHHLLEIIMPDIWG